MKIIFVTRKIDRKDPLTGFIFDWINSFAGKLDELIVFCQEKIDNSGLSPNVTVHSFGKERGFGKLRQLVTLLSLGFRYGKNVAGFLVHMHPVYAIVLYLPALFYHRLLILWYTHKSVDLKLRLAHLLVNRVMTASKLSFRLPSQKVKITGHGINIKKFIPLTRSASDIAREGGDGKKFTIITIGRISPVKDYETLIKATQILRSDHKLEKFQIKIYGKIGRSEHGSYLESLKTFTKNAGLESVVEFAGELPHAETPRVYAQADLFVNLSQTGSIDKTVLEAAACSVPVLTSNEAFREALEKISQDLIFQRDDSLELAKKIIIHVNMPVQEKSRIASVLRNWVENEHDLENLTQKILEEF